MIFSILIAVIAALLLVVIIITLKNFNKSEEGQEVFQKIQKKGKSAILKEAEKSLHMIRIMFLHFCSLVISILVKKTGKRYGMFIKLFMIFHQLILM